MSISEFIRKSFLSKGLLLLLAFLAACERKEGSGGTEEGIIEFQTKAIDETHPLYGFAPDKAVLKYKKHHFALDMSTMGMFNMSIIGNTRDSTLAQTIKFMTLKQACIQDMQDLAEENDEFELRLEETGETKEIAGLKAHKVRVTKVKEPNVTFDAWYTKELGMENSNALTPYAKIKGILLDYRIKKWGLEMHFIAKSYKNVGVPDNTFEIPASMKVVSKEEMEKFFEELQ